MKRNIIIAGVFLLLIAASFVAGRKTAAKAEAPDVVADTLAAVVPDEAPMTSPSASSTPSTPEEDASQFVILSDVVPDIIQEIRYFSTYNFVGRRLPGYLEPVALLTRVAADSLKAVSDELVEKGYRLKIFDAYRPQAAVDYFMKWAEDPSDTLAKRYFYPEIPKNAIIPRGYVARKSGHTRGSTIDLTLFDMRLEKEVDMGGTYDYFGVASHTDIAPGEPRGAYAPITKEQHENRMILQRAMMAHGFRPITGEWWHFTLRNEPFPNTYFTFPVSTLSIHNKP